MIKGNSYLLIFSLLVVLFIIYVSDLPLLMKALLTIMVIGLLIPHVRKVLLIDRYRKINAALFTSFSFTLGLFLFSIASDASDGLLIASVYTVLFLSLLGNLLYGLSVSVVAELISIKFIRYRFWLSGFIHISFGLVAYIFSFLTPIIICSILFFAFDEILRKKVSLMGRELT